MSGSGKDIPLEKTIEAAIRRMLKTKGIWHFKSHGGAFQGSGLPDLICIHNGRFIGLEVKRPEVGRLTENQRAALRKINAAGGYAVVVTSVAEAELAIILSQLGEEAPES